jgi:predicted restriction endonuclease
MDNFIILSFSFNNKLIFDNIFIYCNRFGNIANIELKKKISKFIKNNIIIEKNEKFELTSKGDYILNDLNIYYKRKIVNFYKKYKLKHDKQYSQKETRREQQKLREYLINNYPNICLFCEKKMPYYLLETAHIKPRCQLEYNNMIDYNNIIFLCRICHVLFDRGLIGLYNNELLISSNINLSEYDLHNYKKKLDVSDNKKIYFDFHYKFIFKS